MEMTSTRSTAAVRREEVLDAALFEFAEHGFDGASTDDIARRAGISQPYLFRLFGTKKELFKASVARCLRETLELFQRAAEGKRGKAALEAIGQAYQQQLEGDRRRPPLADAGLRRLRRPRGPRSRPGRLRRPGRVRAPRIRLRLADGLGLLRNRHAVQ